MSWKIIDTGARSAAANMELDSALLSDLKDEKDSILHLYDWEKDAATYGHFVNPQTLLNLSAVKKNNLDLARRPTGGGIIFHNCDLAFSVLVPATSPWFSHNPLDNYAFINHRVVWAIEQILNVKAELLPEENLPLDSHCRNFCMAKPTKYDVMIQGKKIGGAAQRKTKHGFLHQGSISVALLPDSYLEEVLLGGTQVLMGMRQNSTAILGVLWTEKELMQMRKQLRDLLKRAFSNYYE